MENYRLRLALHTPALRGSSRTHRGGTGKGKFPFLLTASPPPTTWARRSVFIIRKGAPSVLSEWPRTVLYEHREDISEAAMRTPFWRSSPGTSWGHRYLFNKYTSSPLMAVRQSDKSQLCAECPEVPRASSLLPGTLQHPSPCFQTTLQQTSPSALKHRRHAKQSPRLPFALPATL